MVQFICWIFFGAQHSHQVLFFKQGRNFKSEGLGMKNMKGPSGEYEIFSMGEGSGSTPMLQPLEHCPG